MDRFGLKLSRWGVLMSKAIQMLPSAGKLMASLRDVGYDLHTAVADVVDNCIMSGASEVHVRLEYAGVGSWVRIHDNGLGMVGSELNEAMRLGSDREYEEGDLGKFGLGMKLASFSQCRRLTVASRKADSETSVRCWDLDHVMQHNSWELLEIASVDCRKEVASPLERSAGTVVFWEALDRLLDKLPVNAPAAQPEFDRQCRIVEEHLCMVFHRYLSGSTRNSRKVTIYLNGNPIEPWDPFCRWHSKTQTLDTETLQFEHEGRTCSVVVIPYVLPPTSEFNNKDRKRSGGPNRWNKQQGFYIYRNDRMIQSGGWNDLRTQDEHSKLARVALDFASVADTAFKINISKMSVGLPGALTAQLEVIAGTAVNAAQKVYREGAAARPVRTTSLPKSSPPVAQVADRPVASPVGETPTAYEADSQKSKTPVADTQSTKAGPTTESGNTPSTPTVGIGGILKQWIGGRTPSPATVSDSKPAQDTSLADAVVVVLVSELGGDKPTLNRVLRALRSRPEFQHVKEV